MKRSRKSHYDDTVFMYVASQAGNILSRNFYLEVHGFK